MIQLIGIPFDANSTILKGPSFAPQRIRLMEAEGSANAFSESGEGFPSHKTKGSVSQAWAFGQDKDC